MYKAGWHAIIIAIKNLNVRRKNIAKAVKQNIPYTLTQELGKILGFFGGGGGVS